ncbi:FG-GAP-like repeat-containing protein [soil metagenome]
MPLSPTNLFYRVIFLCIISLPLKDTVDAQPTIKKSGSVVFKKHIISPFFVSEGVAVADVNKDGKLDILAGRYWFQAPGWQQHVIHTDTLNPVPGYSTSFLNYSMDVNNDGWPDLIRFDQPGGICVWYQNPQNKKVHWQSHLILATAGNENPAFEDVDGDGRMDIICNDITSKQVLWLQSPMAKNDTVWQRHIISNDATRGTDKYTHGLGWGDINKDGHKDVIIKSGWWQSPQNVTDSNWVFHEANFGADCANIFVLDVDKDGDQDIISSSAHDYGVWWYEQQKDHNGNSTWVTHTISQLFSESHSLALEDVNGDGYPDLVTGKRYYAHNGGDPGGHEAAVLYWFEFVPGKNPAWIPQLIDSNSGVGLSFVVQDINKDNKKDIIISNKKGVFFFEQL